MKRNNFRSGFNKGLIGWLFGLLSLAGYGQVKFLPQFNPQLGMVKSAEKPFRDELCLNGKWQIEPLYSEDTSNTSIPAHFHWDDHEIKIPSPWNVNGFPGREIIDFTTYPSYPKKWEKATQAWLKTSFVMPEKWNGDQVILHFEAVAGKAIYYLNGHKIGENFDIFFPYEMDVTDKVRRGQKNELLVLVQGAKMFDHQQKYGRRPYVSGSFWGTWIKGIWEDVYLLSKPPVHIAATYIEPLLDKNRLLVNVTLQNSSDKEQRVTIKGDVHEWIAPDTKGDIINAPKEREGFSAKTVLRLSADKPVMLSAGESSTVKVQVTVSPGQLKEWSPDHPNLQVLLLNLFANGKPLDRKYQRFGWRQFTFDGAVMRLNGQPIQLKGDSWHFMGVPQMTRRYAWSWYALLKKANANAVRLHAEPFPSFYLDVADEMGICVLDESAIWASDGGPDFGSKKYWENCKIHLSHLVHRDRNHPAVFGWSVCNEVIPVAKNVFHMPDSLLSGIVDQINGWVQEVRSLDSTRPWISGDGETDLKTKLPTVVGHYGGTESMDKWSKQGLPWGIGEQGMAYYGTPKQVAKINGSRAFVSQQGRMEGLAREAYGLLKQQQSLHATYSSVFNIVWYGLKPLTLGLKDSTRPTQLTDGIFFTHYTPGRPGMQPERLGPYTTTLNPGYDTSLPLFEPWPFFYAIKDANGRSIINDSAALHQLDAKWAYPHLEKKEPNAVRPKKAYYFSDAQGRLFSLLKHLGLKIAEDKPLPFADASNSLIIIDGLHPPISQDSASIIKGLVNAGARVLILGLDSANLSDINRLLPARVTLTARHASSMIIQAKDAILGGLDNEALYFSELSKKPVMTHGIGGPAVKSGQVLLAASEADWTTWNGQPEYMKTASILKSERVQKPSGAILIKLNQGKGCFYLLGCNAVDANGALNEVVTRMAENLGAGFGAKGQAGNLPLTASGGLQAALYCSRYSNSRMNPSALLSKEFMDQSILSNPVLGQKVGEHQWRAAFVAADNYRFDLKKLAASGPEDGATGYLSFWVHCPRSLSNLLVEPDMPAVDLILESKDAITVKLNNQLLVEHLSDDQPEVHIPNLPLNKGWNHILIKSIHTNGDWQTKVRFQCDHPAFLKELHTALQAFK